MERTQAHILELFKLHREPAWPVLTEPGLPLPWRARQPHSESMLRSPQPPLPRQSASENCSGVSGILPTRMEDPDARSRREKRNQ